MMNPDLVFYLFPHLPLLQPLWLSYCSSDIQVTPNLEAWHPLVLQPRTLSPKSESFGSPHKRHLLQELPDHLPKRGPPLPCHPNAPPLIHVLRHTSQHQNNTILLLFLGTFMTHGFPWWFRQQRICLQCRETGFNPLEKEMATHSSILAWRIPWAEEPDELQSIGSQTVRHDQATTHTQTHGERSTYQYYQKFGRN